MACGARNECGIINEWNWDAGMQPQNDGNLGAVYVASTLCKMIEAGLDYAPFFEIKDRPNENRYYGRWVLYSHDGHPKASYYAFLAFSKIEGNRLSSQVPEAM